MSDKQVTLAAVLTDIHRRWNDACEGPDGWREFGPYAADALLEPPSWAAMPGWTLVRTERLNVQPEDVAEPIGRIRRTWWRLGWLSAQAVARDPAPLAAKLREVGR